jgi:hypothetical protein
MTAFAGAGLIQNCCYREISLQFRDLVCVFLCVCWSCLLDIVINIIYSISLLFICKLRGFRNVLLLLLLGRSFHEVKKSSCSSPVTAPTDTTQRDTFGMKVGQFLL